MTAFPCTAPPAHPHTVRGLLDACALRPVVQNQQAPRSAGLVLEDNTRSLVRRALADDRQAVDALFERYRERLRSALRKLIGPRYRLLLADSEDATQDAILSALARLHKFEYRGDGSFLAWLLKGAEYEVMRRLRAIETRKRRPEGLVSIDAEGAEPEAAQPSPEESADEVELSERIRRALQLLPGREREVIVLRRYMELDTDEVADELGLSSPGAARALLSRAQARLSGILARTGDAP